MRSVARLIPPRHILAPFRLYPQLCVTKPREIGNVGPIRTLWGAKKVSPDEKWPAIQEQIKSGKRAEAAEEMRSILCEHPSHFWSVISLSEMLMQEQKNKEAMEIVNKALQVIPNETTFLTLRASVFQNLGELNSALEDLDKVLTINPTSLPTFLAKAQILTMQGKFKDSLAITDLVISNASALLAGAYFNNSTVSFSMKQYNEALKWSTKALSMEPKAGRSLCAHGMALFSLGRVQEAMKTFESVSKSDPARPLADQQLAEIHRQTGS
eukprot:Phypoly_transcript_15289.p1 GENE.Phypoly_transcript_15289~~Phypoly_transcript_15289.p1  ORF type:complete len:269 (+),score=24.55 Phypoly_transcript_15289:81-887(+)